MTWFLPLQGQLLSALLGTLQENDSKLRNAALPGAQAIEKATWAGDVAQQEKMIATKATKADDNLSWDLQNPPGKRWEPSPKSCPLTTTHVL